MNLLILGAGVEKNLKMPLAYELLPGMINFVYNNEIGRNVDIILKNFFKLNKENDDFLTSIVAKLEKFKKSDLQKVIEEIGNLQNEHNDEDIKLADDIKNLLEIIKKIKNDKQQNDINLDQIDKLLKNILQKYNKDLLNKDTIKLKKTSNNKNIPVSKDIMKNILKISIKDPNNVILKPIYKNLIDFESVLLKYFISLYNIKKDVNFRINLYLIWSLWAYLVWKEQQIWKDNKITKEKIPFYSDINDDINIITFNYTTFAGRFNKKTKYFHGILDKYLIFDTKQEIEINDYQNLNIVEFLNNVVSPKINSEKKYILPSMIPPLKLKPVLSSSYIETWYDTKKLIEKASKIAIIGYSFNYADEHFNDLIRKNMKNRQIIIVNPDIEGIKANVERIFFNNEKNVKKRDFETIENGKIFKKENIILINGRAEKIYIDKLFQNKNWDIWKN